MCSYKSKFVSMVMKVTLWCSRRKKKDLEARCHRLSQNWWNYDYLLNIKTVQYTEESVKALLKEAKQAKEDLEDNENKSHDNVENGY